MANRQYELICRHPKLTSMFAFKVRFNDSLPENRYLVAQMIKIADDYYKRLKEIGFELSSCNFDRLKD